MLVLKICSLNGKHVNDSVLLQILPIAGLGKKIENRNCCEKHTVSMKCIPRSTAMSFTFVFNFAQKWSILIHAVCRILRFTSKDL